MTSLEAFTVLEGATEDLLFEYLNGGGDFHDDFAVSLVERFRVVENDEQVIERESGLRGLKNEFKKRVSSFRGF
ncbi:MAG TPA: hypothetical protein GX706_03075 [Candidatus Moranbacteria bacterium]|nr:hypothetical protein [Candidatus Moranbacteria bacterium]